MGGGGCHMMEIAPRSRGFGSSERQKNKLRVGALDKGRRGKQAESWQGLDISIRIIHSISLPAM